MLRVRPHAWVAWRLGVATGKADCGFDRATEVVTVARKKSSTGDDYQ